jgi:hypothetical protein
MELELHGSVFETFFLPIAATPVGKLNRGRIAGISRASLSTSLTDLTSNPSADRLDPEWESGERNIS